MITKRRMSWIIVISIYLLASTEICLGTVCEFCQRDFDSVNRHIWRCKARVSYRQDHPTGTTVSSAASSQPIGINRSLSNHNNTVPPATVVAFDPHEEEREQAFECYCGRSFKSVRCLNLHRRSCHVVDVPNLNDLFAEDIFANNCTTAEDSGNDMIDDTQLSKVTLRSGVHLPKLSHEWDQANAYFKYALDLSAPISSVDESAKYMQEAVYNYFKSTHGLVAREEDALINKYKRHSKSQLKKSLKQLKANHGDTDVDEIKYVSKLLRRRFQKGSISEDGLDHNSCIRKNFWSYSKKFLESDKRVNPEFSEISCYHFFKSVLSSKKLKKILFLAFMDEEIA